MENVVEKKRIKYWVRELFFSSLMISYFFISNSLNGFVEFYLPDFLKPYSFGFAFIGFLILALTLILLDFPFFKKITITLKSFFIMSSSLVGILFVAISMSFGLTFFANTNPFWIIYAILAGIILLGIIIGFIKRSEQLSK
jgi:hypothetical protein